MWGFKLKSVCMNWYVHENWLCFYHDSEESKECIQDFWMYGCVMGEREWKCGGFELKMLFWNNKGK